VFPQSFLAENAEVLIFAAILAIGIRTFFFQPFKIPTNSMFPTYAGMTFELTDKKPGKLERLKRFITLGATNYLVKAKSKRGKGDSRYNGIIDYDIVNARKWFGILPTQLRRYTLTVGNAEVSIKVPLDFSLDDVVAEALFNKSKDLGEVLSRINKNSFINLSGSIFLNTGIKKQVGEEILSFEILTGDMLIVNKFAYNFRPPSMGDPIVFRTSQIRSLHSDKYYIKRLVGGPGDVLRIEGSGLIRNNEPIAGAQAFEHNRLRENSYPGYVARGNLAKGRDLMIPDKNYFALGDNSPHSLDSRYWRFVSDREIVGKAVVIMYPFTQRWGLAK
jgi:signal peptidase I